MEDYYNYHNFDPKQKLFEDGKKVFELNKSGFDGKDIIIDDLIETRGIIFDHTSPLNEYQEDRKLSVDGDIVINRGSKIHTVEENKTYLVVTNIDNNGIYQYCKIRQTNNLLHIQTGTTQIIKGYDSMGRPIIEEKPTYTDFPCIVASSVNDTRSAELNDPINLPFGRYAITMAYTDKVYEDLEFDMYNAKYKIMYIDYSHVQDGVGTIEFLADRIV